MRKLFIILAASTAIALLYKPSANAAALDANGDGAVTRAEFDAARRHDYRQLDRNGNKALSRREFYHRGAPAAGNLIRQRSRRFRIMDRDDDGGISPSEYRRFGHAQFRRLDLNRDGRLTAGELARAGVTTAKATTKPGGRKKAGESEQALARKLNDISPASSGRKSKKTTKIKQLSQSSDNFDKMDRNRDGFISRGEFRLAMIRYYRVLDRHPNKALSRREYYRTKQQPPKALLTQRKRDYRRIDKDDDGGLSQAEFLAYAPSFFKRLDKNGDKKLDRRELAGQYGVAAAPVRQVERRQIARRPDASATKSGDAKAGDAKSDDGSAAGRSAETAKPVISAPVKQAFARIDKNKDGFVSRKELNDARLQRFNQYDRNLDWGLSKREFLRDRPTMAPRFSQMDANSDGKISWKEYQRAGEARFKAVDRNGDRKISLAEFAGQG